MPLKLSQWLLSPWVTSWALGPSFTSQAKKLHWMCFCQVCASSFPDLKLSCCQLHGSLWHQKARGHYFEACEEWGALPGGCPSAAARLQAGGSCHRGRCRERGGGRPRWALCHLCHAFLGGASVLCLGPALSRAFLNWGWALQSLLHPLALFMWPWSPCWRPCSVHAEYTSQVWFLGLHWCFSFSLFPCKSN